MSALVDTVVLLTAPILLNTVALLVRRSALVVAWVEENALTVPASVITVSRVRTVPPLNKQEGNDAI